MKKYFKMIALAILLLPSMVFAKEYNLKEFGYSKGEFEATLAVSETNDGGYVTTNLLADGVMLVKYDKNDEIVWETEKISHSFPLDIDIDSEGNIFVTGYTYGDDRVYYNTERGFIAIYDKDGKELETLVFGDYSKRTLLYDLEVDDEKVVAVGKLCPNLPQESAGPIPYDIEKCGFYSLIYDRKNDEFKEKYLNYNGKEQFTGVTLTKDGGYLAVGLSESTDIPGIDMNLYTKVSVAIKYDKDFNVEWTYGYPIDTNITSDLACSYDDEPLGFNDVVETCDGNFAIVGGVHKLSKVKVPRLESSSNTYKEILKGIDFEDNEYQEVEVGTSAAILLTLDKNGKKVNEYIEDPGFDDVYTDILVTDNCSLLVSGFIGEELNVYSTAPSSLDDNLGIAGGSCFPDNHEAILRVFDEDLKLEWSKTYKGSDEDLLLNVSPVSNNEFVAVGAFQSVDMEEVQAKEYLDGLIVRLNISYEINLEETENGKFEANNQNGKSDIVYHGDTATITVTPDEGYKVNSVKVVDSKGNEVTVTKLENGKYEYKITDDTWVSVTFAKKAIIEIPKTGVATYISLLLLVVPTLGLIYLNIKEKSLFKKI